MYVGRLTPIPRLCLAFIGSLMFVAFAFVAWVARAMHTVALKRQQRTARLASS